MRKEHGSNQIGAFFQQQLERLTVIAQGLKTPWFTWYEGDFKLDVNHQPLQNGDFIFSIEVETDEADVSILDAAYLLEKIQTARLQGITNPDGILSYWKTPTHFDREFEFKNGVLKLSLPHSMHPANWLDSLKPSNWSTVQSTHLVSARRSRQEKTIDERRLKALVTLVSEQLNQGKTQKEILSELLRNEQIGEESEARVQETLSYLPGIETVDPTVKWGDLDFINKVDLVVVFDPESEIGKILSEVNIQVKSSPKGCEHFRKKFAEKIGSDQVDEYLCEQRLIILNGGKNVDDTEIIASFREQLNKICQHNQLLFVFNLLPQSNLASVTVIQ